MLCSAFFECADNMGVFEWNTVSNTFVQFFGNITGYVSVAPGDDEVLVVGYDSNVNVLKPQGECQDPFVRGHRLLSVLCERIIYLSIESRGVDVPTPPAALWQLTAPEVHEVLALVVSDKDTCLWRF